MPHFTEPICSTCNERVDPMRLYVRKISFAPIKLASRPIKTVITAHICDTCLLKDPDYNRPPSSGPGHTSQAKKRIEQRKSENG